MPKITTTEIDELNTLFADVAKAAKEIKNKAPNCREACADIEKRSETAYELLRKIKGRDSN
jgi:hypothetical protein